MSDHSHDPPSSEDLDLGPLVAEGSDGTAPTTVDPPPVTAVDEPIALPPAPSPPAPTPSPALARPTAADVIRGTATLRGVRAEIRIGGMEITLQADEVVTSFDTAGSSTVASATGAGLSSPDGESRALGDQELQALLDAQPDGGEDLLRAMVPGVDSTRVRSEVERAIAGKEAFIFVSEPSIDEKQLERFNTLFQSKLAQPITGKMARDMTFQTEENWRGYVTTGAAHFIAGGVVSKPLRHGRQNAARELTHEVRSGQDPAQSPLRMALFADFGNGLYAAREVARRIIERKLPYAFHLGDVYYDGTEKEFADYFAKPLEPLLPTTELFMVAGNHEMYSRGVPFQRYLADKARRFPAMQRQNAEMFRLRGPGFQIIGLDTMWCGWESQFYRGNAPKLDQSTKDLLESWLIDKDPSDDLTILLSSNEPWTIDSDKPTQLRAELEPFIRRGLIDLWFWGNVHHCALYEGWQFKDAVEPGFVSSCVGHAGYPFYTQKKVTLPPRVSARWVERKHRFWPFAGVRSDVGLNGWCELGLSRDSMRWEVSLLYRDWVGRERARATIHKPRAMSARIVSAEENHSPDPGGVDWQKI
jgi:hypothetical protein